MNDLLLLSVLFVSVLIGTVSSYGQRRDDIVELLRDEGLYTSKVRWKRYDVIAGSGDHEPNEFRENYINEPILLDFGDDGLVSKETRISNRQLNDPVDKLANVSVVEDTAKVAESVTAASAVSEAITTKQAPTVLTPRAESASTTSDSPDLRISGSTTDVTPTPAHECNETFCKNYEASSIAVSPQLQKAKIGSEAVFECVVSTDLPDLSPTWEILELSTENYNIEYNGTLASTLIIGNLSLKHSNEYYCRLNVPPSCCQYGLEDKGQLVVYEDANYIKHLIIGGAISAAGIMACIVLHIRRRGTYKAVAVDDIPSA